MVGSPVGVVVVDDQRTVAEALGEALDHEASIRVVAVVDGPAQASALLDDDEVDVFCIKLDADARPALSFLRSAASTYPHLAFIAVSAPGSDDRAAEAITSGARGWVSHRDSLSELVEAILSVATGELHLPVAALTEGLLPAGSRPGTAGTRPVLAALSPRQTEVLLCLMQGLTQAEAGKVLDMSPNTVRTHVQAVLRRLDVHSTLAAVAVARRNGVTGPVLSVDGAVPAVRDC